MNKYEILIENNKPIPFPYLTFKDDQYSEFMTSIMKTLEIRYYSQDYAIA